MDGVGREAYRLLQQAQAAGVADQESVLAGHYRQIGAWLLRAIEACPAHGLGSSPCPSCARGRRWLAGAATADKDVVRTDQESLFFAGAGDGNNPNLVQLRNVLMAYAVHDPALGTEWRDALRVLGRAGWA